MSPRRRSSLPNLRRAPLFAALGDETRLTLIAKLSEKSPSSISQLCLGLPITRQAITKHLQVLESVGVVHGEVAGRERLFALDPKPLAQAKDYLDLVSKRWDEALHRLQLHLES